MDVPLSTIGGPLRPGIVHRLDAGTSGLMVMALTDDAHEALAAMLKRPRRSNAATWRWCAAWWNTTAFAIDAPLGRRADQVVVDRTEGRDGRDGLRGRANGSTARRCSRRPRRPAGPTRSACICRRSTTRSWATGPTAARVMLAKRLGLQRPFLHSASIAFDQPMTGERIELDEPLARGSRERVAEGPGAGDRASVRLVEAPGRGSPTCTLDDGPGRAYVRPPANHTDVSYPQLWITAQWDRLARGPEQQR